MTQGSLFPRKREFRGIVFAERGSPIRSLGDDGYWGNSGMTQGSLFPRKQEFRGVVFAERGCPIQPFGHDGCGSFGDDATLPLSDLFQNDSPVSFEAVILIDSARSSKLWPLVQDFQLRPTFVIPTKAGIRGCRQLLIPAFARMTLVVVLCLREHSVHGGLVPATIALIMRECGWSIFIPRLGKCFI